MRSGSVQIQAGEGFLDPRQLFLGGLGRLAVEDALLHAVFDDRIENLRRGVVQRVVQQQPGVAPRRAPFRGAGGGVREGRGLHRPGGDLDGVPNLRVAVPMTSATKASISAAGIQGAPSRAVMSDGRKSSGWTRRSAATLR